MCHFRGTMAEYFLHTSEYDKVPITPSGFALCTKLTYEDDLIVDHVQLPELQMVAQFCDAAAANAPSAYRDWIGKLRDMSIAAREKLYKAALLMGVDGIKRVCDTVICMDDAKKFKISSNDGQEFTVSLSFLRQNVTLFNMLQVCMAGQDDSELVDQAVERCSLPKM